MIYNSWNYVTTHIYLLPSLIYSSSCSSPSSLAQWTLTTAPCICEFERGFGIHMDMGGVYKCSRRGTTIFASYGIQDNWKWQCGQNAPKPQWKTEIIVFRNWNLCTLLLNFVQNWKLSLGRWVTNPPPAVHACFISPVFPFVPPRSARSPSQSIKRQSFRKAGLHMLTVRPPSYSSLESAADHKSSLGMA